MNEAILIEEMKQSFDLDAIFSLDFETFYGKGYSLKNKPYYEYVMDERFRAQMLGVGENAEPIVILDACELDDFAEHIRARRMAGERIGVIAQNTHFDAAILSWRFGLTFDFYFDAMLLSRLRYINHSASLKNHAQRIWPDDEELRKGDTLKSAMGIEDLHSVPGLYEDMSVYCRQDVNLTRKIVLWHWESRKVPHSEWLLMHITLRACVEPQFWINRTLLNEVVADEEELKASLVDEANEYLLANHMDGVTEATYSSNQKYKELIELFGMKVPYKMDPETYEMKPALGKSDPEYVKFQGNHPEMKPIFRARNAIKSTIAVSRANRLIDVATTLPLHGFIPFPLNYHEAHTGRWCLTPDHEVLTPFGWKRMDEWGGEPIMEYNADGSMNWCDETTMNVFACNEPLIRLSNNAVSAVMTKDHKMVNLRRDTKVVSLKTAEEVKELSNFDLPLAGQYEGSLRLSNPEITLLCAAQADGSWMRERLSFGLRKERKIQRLEDAMLLMGLNYSKTVGWTGGKETTFFSLHYSDLPEAMAYLEGKEKNFDWRLLELDTESAQRFLEELSHWDGWNHQRNGAVNYSTCNRHNADFVQALAHTNARKVGFHERDHVKEGNSTAFQLYLKTSSCIGSTRKENFSEEGYTGKVYCPTVTTGMFLVRHDNKVHVTGNSGAQKMNVQNLQRKSKHRLCLTAPEGHVVLVRDLSGIELRMNLWFCEQDDLLEIAHAGDIYSLQAESVLGHPVNKKDNPDDRQLGKVITLGMGYGMGWKTFQAYMAGGPMGMDPVFFPTSFCREVKAGYDLMNPQIKRMWHFLNSIVIPAMTDPACDMEVGRHGCVKVRYQKLILPSGRELQYDGLHGFGGEDAKGYGVTYRYDDGTRDRFKKVVWKYLYGGLLLENIIQALARDVVAYHIVLAENEYIQTKYGWVVGSVHDEILSIIQEVMAQEAYDRLGAIMSTPPTWCYDLPLASEGGWDKVYSK